MNWTTIEKLREKAGQMPPGFLDEVMAEATVDGERVLLSQAAYQKIKAKYLPPPLQGAGDLVAKFAKPIARAIDRVAKTDLQNCNKCKQRQAKLNTALPFTRNKEPNHDGKASP